MYTGKGQLVSRLTWQVGGDAKLAKEILRKRGHMKQESEELTPMGEARNQMTAAEREADRGQKSGSSNRTRNTIGDAFRRLRS